ncbi:MAG: Sigma-54 dependent transcriptional regulator [Myxococcales bacterium]|nr:Sigma-54 dependent transcriptional regulator [Myxococcales bacterium]
MDGGRSRSMDTTEQLGHRGTPLTVSLRKVRVEVVQGPDRGAFADLGDAPLLIGRAPECQLLLTDTSVSWMHVELSLDVAGVQLRNLGSSNGVQVGAALVEEARVEPGTCILLGRTVISLTATEAEAEMPFAPVQRFGGLCGRSLAMKMVFGRLQKFAGSEAPVLIEGPTGTGKELAARALHDASTRASGPFEIIDCGAIPRHLMEAELFGVVKGAYTGADVTREGLFERASNGTVVLDEIAELPIELQPKLLGVLERGILRRLGDSKPRKVSVRVVATTNRVLAREVQAGRFRQDLYFRLTVLRVAIPALRDRREDIPLLLEQFLEGAAPLPPAWMRVLEEHDWQGNVRELRNLVEQARAQRAADGTPLIDLHTALSGGAVAALPPIAEARMSFEKDYLRALLTRSGNNIRKAAAAAGLTRQGLYGLLARNGLRGSSED